MSKTRFALLAAAAVFATAGMNGCYTMLVHPEVQMTDDVTKMEKTVEVTHLDRCTDCHTREGVNGTRAASSGYHSETYEGWSDYDPFWGYEGYYNPVWTSPFSSTSFNDNYYSYRNLPWWVYPSASDGGGYSGSSQAASSSDVKDKPARRGTDDSRSGTQAPSISGSSAGSGASKASSAPAQSGSGNDSDSGKEKPARRGGIK